MVIWLVFTAKWQHIVSRWKWGCNHSTQVNTVIETCVKRMDKLSQTSWDPWNECCANLRDQIFEWINEVLWSEKMNVLMKYTCANLSLKKPPWSLYTVYIALTVSSVLDLTKWFNPWGVKSQRQGFSSTTVLTFLARASSGRRQSGTASCRG